jgi:hypothetical protein
MASRDEINQAAITQILKLLMDHLPPATNL